MTPTTSFLTTTSKTTQPVASKAPIKSRANRLSLAIPRNIKVLLYGPIGSGKTYTAVEMLKAGERILMLSSDFGGSGAETVRNALIGTADEGLLDNLYELESVDYTEIKKFIEDPKSLVPDIWDFNPTVFFWDGFSNFQTNILPDHVSSFTDHKKAESLTEARKEGLMLENQDWGMIRKGSLDILNGFLSLTNPNVQGTPIKIVACHMDTKLKPSGSITQGSVIVETRKPLLQGAAGVLAAGGFSLVLQTKVTTMVDDKSKRIYSYITQGHEGSWAKNRGYKLQPEETSFTNIWAEVKK